jgi:hypothetical protein
MPGTIGSHSLSIWVGLSKTAALKSSNWLENSSVGCGEGSIASSVGASVGSSTSVGAAVGEELQAAAKIPNNNTPITANTSCICLIHSSYQNAQQSLMPFHFFPKILTADRDQAA